MAKEKSAGDRYYEAIKAVSALLRKLGFELVWMQDESAFRISPEDNSEYWGCDIVASED